MPEEVQILKAVEKRMTVMPLPAWTLALASRHTGTSHFHGRRCVTSTRGQWPLLPTPDTSSENTQIVLINKTYK